MEALKEGQEERIIKEVSRSLDRELERDSLLRESLMDEEDRDHVVRIGTSILFTKWGIGYPGGSFVRSIVDNDLMGAFSRADHINRHAIGFYCSLLYNTGYIG